MVHDSQDRVVSPTLRQLRNEIHGHYFEWLGFWWYRDAVEGGLAFVRQIFALLALCTSFDVFFYPSAHAWPPELSCDCCDRFVASRVSCCWGVVEVLQDDASKVVVWWDCVFSVFHPEFGI